MLGGNNAEWMRGLMSSRSRTIELPSGEPLLVLAVVVLALYFAQALLIPLAFALTLSFFLSPAVSRLEKIGLKRVFAVAIVAVGTSLLLLACGWIVSRQLMSVADRLPEYQVRMHTRISAYHSGFAEEAKKALDSLDKMSGDFVIGGRRPSGTVAAVSVVDPGRSEITTTADALMGVLRPVGMVGVVIVFALYMLMKREELRHRLLLLAGMGHINLMSQALSDAANRISQYLLMQMLVNACYGLLFGLGLFAIGIPNATLWGFIAGLLRIVPYVGTATGVVLPLIVAIAVATSWWPVIAVLALFLVLELSATNFVEPWLYSSRTGISSLALLATAIFWALMWGWAGLVLSTPLTVCVVVMGRYVPQLSFLQTLLGTKAELSPEAHFYERLIAMDQNEAHAVAHRFLKKHSLVELYDRVVLPALSMAEQDRHKGALDQVRWNYLFLAVTELVAELTEYKGHAPALEVSQVSHLSKSPEATEFAVVCITAKDQADELTTLMLAQVIERAGHQTLVLSASSLSDEILERLGEEAETVVFVSALPPFAFSEAKDICLRVRTHMQENRVIVGFWNEMEDVQQIGERFGAGRPDYVVTTLTQALVQLGSGLRDRETLHPQRFTAQSVGR